MNDTTIPVHDKHRTAAKQAAGDNRPPLGDPQSFTPMMLIHEVDKLFGLLVRTTSTMTELQNSYRQLLFHLSIQDGCTQLKLAQLTHLKPPTVSVTLQKMEHDGYVTRRPDENDLRQTLVYLTDKGHEYNKVVHDHIQTLDRLVTQGITEEEAESLKSILVKMRGNLMAELSETPSGKPEQEE